MKIPVKFCSYQQSSAVNSCQKMMTADENKNQPRELKFGTCINFSVYMNIPHKYSLLKKIGTYITFRE